MNIRKPSEESTLEPQERSPPRVEVILEVRLHERGALVK